MDEEILVSWRAAIVPENGGQPVFGFLSKIGKRSAVMKTEQNLQPGYRCNLAVMLPKNRADDAVRVIEVPSRVSASVLTSTQFHISLDWLEMCWSDEALLEEYIRKYKATWKIS